MSETNHGWWWKCLGFGLATILVSVYFGLIPDAEGCPPHPELGAVIAFEIVRSPADVSALFGASDCTGPFTAAMRHITTVDAFAFIPAFTLFLISALMALRIRSPRLATIGIVCALLGALADQVEGILLFRIMDDLPGTQATIDWLVPFVRGKFLMLAAATGIAGWLMAHCGRLWILAGALVLLPSAMTLLGVVDDGQAHWLTSGLGLAWAALFLFAGAATFATWRHRRSA